MSFDDVSGGTIVGNILAIGMYAACIAVVIAGALIQKMTFQLDRAARQAKIDQAELQAELDKQAKMTGYVIIEEP